MKPEECCQKLKGVKKDIKGGGGGDDIGSVYIRVIKPSTHCPL